MKTTKSLNIPLLRLSGMLLVIVIIAVGLLSGCKKKTNETSSGGVQPYSNMSDTSTTKIIASIPRIELSKLKSTQINLYLSVTDQNGKPFSDFNQYNFIIKQVCVGSQDTAMIASMTFEKLNKTGNNIATPLVLDYSGSMDGYIGDLETATGNFIVLKNPNDQIELIKFSSYIERIQRFTTDTTRLLDSLHNYWSWQFNNTAFYSAMAYGLNDVEAFNNTRNGFMPAVIGFTDGQDNQSTISQTDLISLAINKQIPLYTLGFGMANDAILDTIAKQTGGRYYYTPDITTLKNLFAMISGQLKNLYQVSWVYSNTNCSQVLLIVEANYTCKKGTFAAKTQKVFYPFVK